MFRITRGITIQHAPAFGPMYRFPDGTPLPIYRDDEPAADQGEPEASAAPTTGDGTGPAASAEAPDHPPE